MNNNYYYYNYTVVDKEQDIT